MKKVLFMLSSMNIGGVEKSLLSLLSVIPKEKYDITILLLEKKGGFIEYVPDWIKVEEVTWYKKVKPTIIQSPYMTVRDYWNNREFFKIPSFVSSYILSEKLFKDRYIFYKNIFKVIPQHIEEYDVAISYQGPTDIIDYFIANRVTAKRKLSWVHFDVSKHMINEKLYNKLYKKFDKVFAVSKEAQKKLVEKIPAMENKTEVFMNILSKKIIKEMSKEKVDFDENYEGIRIVTVGRFSREKGQDIAIKVLSRLRQNGYEVRWYCVGDGNQRKLYEQLIKEYDLINDFILLGAKTNPFPYMERSDIYVQPSRHEGYCLTLAEAKCLNKPIVTTDFIGAHEQIINGHNGWIVEISEDELYEQIKSIIKDPIKQNKLVINLSNNELDTTIEVEKLLRYIN
ncbi:glycosyltransferase [Oceanobacillus halophilus]|uniref:Glycosyltransferase n=1 Tax=Oceanobacillus halophilus TaxID=930130 RepID=A0A495A320_9BACI|nr:glycosyltransferase [Oceanobacillus halophilus]RKQ33484.1 glycosyltransferase [Oceanobacillus halophilus]